MLVQNSFFLNFTHFDTENQTFQEKYKFATEKNENSSEYSINSYQNKGKKVKKKSEGQLLIFQIFELRRKGHKPIRAELKIFSLSYGSSQLNSDSSLLNT